MRGVQLSSANVGVHHATIKRVKCASSGTLHWSGWWCGARRNRDGLNRNHWSGEWICNGVQAHGCATYTAYKESLGIWIRAGYLHAGGAGVIHIGIDRGAACKKRSFIKTAEPRARKAAGETKEIARDIDAVGINAKAGIIHPILDSANGDHARGAVLVPRAVGIAVIANGNVHVRGLR